jgi:hypothetical protein
MGVDWHGTWRRERNRGSQKPGGRNSSHGQSGSSRSDRLEGACSLPGSRPAGKCTNSCAPISLRVNGAAACAIPLPIIGGGQPPRKRVRSQCDVMQRTGPAQVQLEDPIKVASTSPASPGPIARHFGVVSVTQSTQDAPHNGSLLEQRARLARDCGLGQQYPG